MVETVPGIGRIVAAAGFRTATELHRDSIVAVDTAAAAAAAAAFEASVSTAGIAVHKDYPAAAAETVLDLVEC